jgi:hypothetical protein
MNADCAWQSQQGCYNPWVQQSNNYMVPYSNSYEHSSHSALSCEMAPTPTSTNANSSTNSNDGDVPHRVQSAARAAKRQRGRERRKMYRAAAHATKCLEIEVVEKEKQVALDFEATHAAVSVELKLVVKNTFFDYASEDVSSEDEQIPLPAAFIETTEETDEWRRNYRRFRLGHHNGSKGELSALSA